MKKRQLKKEMKQVIATHKPVQKPDTIASMVGEIMELSLQVNRETNYCIFIRYSGHVEGLEINIAESKKNYDRKVTKFETYLDPKRGYKTAEEKIIERLRKAKDQMEYILEYGKVPYHDMKVTTYEQEEYWLG